MRIITFITRKFQGTKVSFANIFRPWIMDEGTLRCPDLKELRKLSSFVLDPLDFKQHHGKLLFVLSVDVVEGLLSVLVQFYDLLYRCFTFPDCLR